MSASRFVLLSVVVTLFLAVGITSACSCAAYIRVWTDYPLVFNGTISAVAPDGDFQLRVTFDQLTVYRGAVSGSSIAFRVANNSAACGYGWMEVGQRWLVTATNTTSVTYPFSTNLCDLTCQVTQSSCMALSNAILAGTAQTPTPTSGAASSGHSWFAALLAALSGLIIAAILV